MKSVSLYISPTIYQYASVDNKKKKKIELKREFLE